MPFHRNHSDRLEERKGETSSPQSAADEAENARQGMHGLASARASRLDIICR